VSKIKQITLMRWQIIQKIQVRKIIVNMREFETVLSDKCEPVPTRTA
jgi:hypothetical protein